MGLELMGGYTGKWALQQLLAAEADARVIILTEHHDSVNTMAEVVHIGAYGFMTKNCSPEELIDAIMIVSRGGHILPPQLRRQLFERGMRGNQYVDLTPTERRVLEGMASGLTNHQIAVELTITDGTVRNHCSSVFRKLGVRGRSQATAAALRAGLVQPVTLGHQSARAHAFLGSAAT